MRLESWLDSSWLEWVVHARACRQPYLRLRELDAACEEEGDAEHEFGTHAILLVIALPDRQQLIELYSPNFYM